MDKIVKYHQGQRGEIILNAENHAVLSLYFVEEITVSLTKALYPYGTIYWDHNYLQVSMPRSYH